jgi:hypothetical protein
VHAVVSLTADNTSAPAGGPRRSALPAFAPSDSATFAAAGTRSVASDEEATGGTPVPAVATVPSSSRSPSLSCAPWREGAAMFLGAVFFGAVSRTCPLIVCVIQAVQSDVGGRGVAGTSRRGGSVVTIRKLFEQKRPRLPDTGRTLGG